jgi:hypothetical protein
LLRDEGDFDDKVDWEKLKEGMPDEQDRDR